MGTSDPFTILLGRIRNGIYPVGSWLASERELAAEMRVHRNTVRRAIGRLGELGYVSRQPGCRPIVLARTTRADPPKTVALLMGNEPRFQAFESVLRGCEQELTPADYRITSHDTYATARCARFIRETVALESLLRNPVEGIILWCQNPVSALPFLHALMEQGTAIVLIDRIAPGLDADFVGVDNIAAAEGAVGHLLEMGHRRVALLTWNEDVSPIVGREEGYRRALARYGLIADERLICRMNPDGHDKAVQAAADALMAGPDRPTAVFAINDIIAQYLITAVGAMGLQVPEDLAVAGFDDMEAFAIHSPYLTTVRQSFEDIGRHAARVLLDRFAAPEAPVRHTLLGTSLIVRGSSRPSQETPAVTWDPAETSSQNAPVKVKLTSSGVAVP